MKKTILIACGTVLALALSAQSISDTVVPIKKKYEYIYGIGVSPTMDGYIIVSEEIIDSVEVIDSVSVK